MPRFRTRCYGRVDQFSERFGRDQVPRNNHPVERLRRGESIVQGAPETDTQALRPGYDPHVSLALFGEYVPMNLTSLSKAAWLNRVSLERRASLHPRYKDDAPRPPFLRLTE